MKYVIYYKTYSGCWCWRSGFEAYREALKFTEDRFSKGDRAVEIYADAFGGRLVARYELDE